MCSSLPGRLSGTSSLGGCEISTIDHMPGDGNSTRPTRRKLEPVAGEQRLEHLLQAAIDRAHHRHAAEQPLAEIDQLAADQVGGEEAEHGQREHGDDQPGAGQAERQIGLRPIGDRHERPHQAVDPGHEPPGQIEGDGDRAGDDQAGQKIVAKPGHQAAGRVRRQLTRGHGRRQFFAVHTVPGRPDGPLRPSAKPS